MKFHVLNLQVRFGYSASTVVFDELSINADMDSRIALVSGFDVNTSE